MNFCSAQFPNFVLSGAIPLVRFRIFANAIRLVFLALSFLAISTAEWCSGQSNEPAGEAQGVMDENFEKHVRPLLIAKCYECHSHTTEKNGGLAVDSLEAIIQGGDSGPSISRQSLDESLILQAVRYRNPKLQMPPDGRLSPGEIKVLEDWVLAGAKVSSDYEKSPSSLTTKSIALSVQQARTHWAYRPISKPIVPTSDELNPIDAWITKACEEQQIAPSPLVDEKTWIRRLAIDLHGINPSYDMMQEAQRTLANLPDKSLESARLQFVDHLLSSPRYSERFARHWMDVVRYAESLTLRGFVLPDVWRYRNYLIDAYNSDRPFNQVIVEQIAGDLLLENEVANQSLEERQKSLVATTFWAMGDHNYEEQDKKQLEMDAVDEQIEVLGRTFLAQTLGCARCHDHKFDPIPTADYYAIAGILKSSVSMEHENVSKWIRIPLPLPSDEQAELDSIAKQLAAIKKEIAELKPRLKSGEVNGKIVQSAESQGIVIDDQQAKKVGIWKESNSVKAYVDQGYLHDENKEQGKKSVTFEPTALETGTYTVRISYAYGDNRSSKTQVRVFSADGETLIIVDQKSPPIDDGLWFTLGKFRFEKEGAAFVIISNEQADGHVIADSVQFLPETNTAADKVTGYKSDDSERESIKSRVSELEKRQSKLQNQLDSRPMFQTIKPATPPSDIPIHVRGSVHRLGQVVPRGFLSCINSHEPELNTRIRIEPSSNGRLELALWLVAPENPLTARVYVNRIWHHLLGQGIVPTLDNFGTTGQSPSNPELLDWLASEFIAHGWSTKWLVRTIVTSKAYRRSLASESEYAQKDPDNLHFARGNLRRLDSESIRDSMLQSSGELLLGGSVESTIRKGTSADYGYEHDVGLRSVYLPWFRNALPPMVRDFDGANPSYSISQRNRSTVATQALAMMNNPWVRDRARAVVNSLPQVDAQQPDSESQARAISDIFRQVLGRDPEQAEQAWAIELLQQADLEELAHQLFASIDFRYAP